MFTGIVESVGRVTQIDTGSILRLVVENPFKFGDVKKGTSISVNGTCLTVLEALDLGKSESYRFEVSKETAQKTNLGSLKTGAALNLERCVPANGRFEGHIVLGHVDMTVRLTGVEGKSSGEKIFEFEYDSSNSQFFVEKGSVALNGISLTLVDVGRDTFKTVILPYTLEKTNFRFLKNGDLVNCEVDILGKYLKRFVEKLKGESKIDSRFLKEHGFING